MVNKILFWSGFGENILQSWRNITVSNLLHAGLAVRFWQLGIEMRPFFQRENWLIYPIYGGLGASFGYWLQGVEDRQMRYLSETRQRLIEKRKRRAQREGAPEVGTYQQREQEGLHASPRFVVERDALERLFREHQSDLDRRLRWVGERRAGVGEDVLEEGVEDVEEVVEATEVK